MDMVRLKRLLSYVEEAARKDQSGGVAIHTPALTAEEIRYFTDQIKALMNDRKRYSVGWMDAGNGHRISVKFPARSRPAPSQLELELFRPRQSRL